MNLRDCALNDREQAAPQSLSVAQSPSSIISRSLSGAVALFGRFVAQIRRTPQNILISVTMTILSVKS